SRGNARDCRDSMVTVITSERKIYVLPYNVIERSSIGCLRSKLSNETRPCTPGCDYLFMKKQNEVIDNLIETLKDGQEGFKQAAESVRNPALKALFSDYSQQRSRFATELQSEGRRHGETEPETSSSATGALHRG